MNHSEVKYEDYPTGPTYPTGPGLPCHAVAMGHAPYDYYPQSYYQSMVSNYDVAYPTPPGHNGSPMSYWAGNLGK